MTDPPLGRIRIVVDAVGFVRSMIYPSRAWGEIVHRQSEQVETILSRQMLVEIERVMRYPKVVAKLKSAEAADSAMLRIAIEGATFVEVTDVPKVCRDPGDDIVLATALAAAADIIVTEDKDLLDMGEYEGIRIVTGLELLRILRKQ